jgi:ABC-type glycerol-3-phosphate transport system permease component
MPIIGKVGTRSWKGRTLHTSIHVILLLGAVTMIYPFLIMISSSFRSNVDVTEFSIIPKYFRNDEVLFKKYVESRDNENSSFFQDQYRGRFASFKQLTFPDKPDKPLYEDWTQFINQYPERDTVFNYLVAEHYSNGIYTRNERAFRNMMKKENHGSLEEFNRHYQSQASSWDEVKIEERDLLFRNFTGEYLGLLRGYGRFRKTVPMWQRDYPSIDGHFINSEFIQEFGENIASMNEKLGTHYVSWNDITLNRTVPGGALRPYWLHYVRKVLNVHHIGVDENAVGMYRSYLIEKYDDISLLNTTYHSSYTNFEQIRIPNSLPRSGALLVDWIFFIENLAPEQSLYIKSTEFAYRDWLQVKYKNIAALNHSYFDPLYPSLVSIKLPETVPEYNVAFRYDWLDFIQNKMDEKHLGIQTTAQTDYIAFLKTLYPGADSTLDVSAMNKALGTTYLKEIDVYPSPTIPGNSTYKMIWLVFVKQKADSKYLKISPLAENEWQQYISSKYKNIHALRKAYHYEYQSFETVPLDNWNIDYFTFRDHQKNIFWELTKRNYQKVLDLMLYNGRAMLNTLIYCLLAIFTALIVNPLAAYAMSRYKLKATYKILLVLMLTMAFPPMVMGIPNFLMLKHLSLLNTFWALILPAAADGYFIFLLKGFFDSLPRELFESATMDGAGEFRIFWQIAMSLSKPIMAVIALGAFNDAYRNFMFAFIVCQDEKMWTMMVHIYQLMQNSSPGVGYAALVIAAIPTFAVFVFFQNIIIKGIVVPTEK